MVVVPLVLSSIISGVASVGSGSNLGRLGLKTLSFYIVTSFVAILTGLFLVNLFQPGTGSGIGVLLQPLPQYYVSHDCGGCDHFISNRGHDVGIWNAPGARRSRRADRSPDRSHDDLGSTYRRTVSLHGFVNQLLLQPRGWIINRSSSYSYILWRIGGEKHSVISQPADGEGCA